MPIAHFYPTEISHICDVIHISVMLFPLSEKGLDILSHSFLLLASISGKGVSVNPAELLGGTSGVPWNMHLNNLVVANTSVLLSYYCSNLCLASLFSSCISTPSINSAYMLETELDGLFR